MGSRYLCNSCAHRVECYHPRVKPECEYEDVQTYLYRVGPIAHHGHLEYPDPNAAECDMCEGNVHGKLTKVYEQV